MSFIIGCYSIPDVSDNPYPTLIHDHNLSVIQNGSIKKHLHHERISRKKFDSNLPDNLDKIARKLDLIDKKEAVFVFVDHEIGRSCLSKTGKIRFEAPLTDKLESGLEKAKLYWYGNWPEAYIINHELAHIYSCLPFYGRFKENSLLIHFDGGASKSNFSAWHYLNGKVSLIESHYKYKWLSGLFNANALVFAIVKSNLTNQNAVPGKFMGLEAYGKYRKDIEVWLKKEDFFFDIWKSKKRFFNSTKENFNINISEISNKDPFIWDIAATIHEIFIREMLLAFRKLAQKTHSEYLYYSGGAALNIKLNARIIQSALFKDVYIPPCTNDSGLSLGAAAAVSELKGIPIEKCNPYLNNFGIEKYVDYSYTTDTIKKVSDKIANSEVIGICNGFAECGPRTLGNRSIIARADTKLLAKKISVDYKKREWYRPIAPVMLIENAQYFTGLNTFPVIADYMLTEFHILKEKQDELQGCTHIDGTARIQIIRNREQNPFIYDLLYYLDKNYEIKSLINTSFNIAGEPIAHTVTEAKVSAKNMNLDAVVINGKLEQL